MKDIYGIDIGSKNIVVTKISENEKGSLVTRLIENELGKKQLKYKF